MGVLPAICFVYSIKRGSFSFPCLGGTLSNSFTHTQRKTQTNMASCG